MGLSESSLTYYKALFFKIIVRYHVIHHAVLKYAETITIAFLIPIHTEMLTATAIVIKSILINK